MAGEFDLDKLEKLAHNAVSVGNVEESVALCLIDMLNSDSAAQMERANTAERTLGLIYAYCYNFTSMTTQLGNKHKFQFQQHMGNIQKHRAAVLIESNERKACSFLSDQGFLDLFNFSELHLRTSAISKCTQLCRDLVDLSSLVTHLDHLVSLVRRLLCGAQWQPNSSLLKRRTLEFFHMLLCRFGRSLGPPSCSLIAALVQMFGDGNKEVHRLAVLAVDQIGRCVSPQVLFKHLLVDAHLVHDKWPVRLNVLRAVVQCAVLNTWAVDVTRVVTAIYPLIWDDHRAVVDMCIETLFVLQRVDVSVDVVLLLSKLHQTHTTLMDLSPEKRTAVESLLSRRLETPCIRSQPLDTDPPIALLHHVLVGEPSVESAVGGGGHSAHHGVQENKHSTSGRHDAKADESKLRLLRTRMRNKPASRRRKREPQNAPDDGVPSRRTVSAPVSLGRSDPSKHTITEVTPTIQLKAAHLAHTSSQHKQQLSGSALETLSRDYHTEDNTRGVDSSNRKKKERWRPKTLVSFGEFNDDASDVSSTRGIDISSPISAPGPSSTKMKFTFDNTPASACVPSRHRTTHVSNYKAPKDRVVANYKGSGELQPLEHPASHLHKVQKQISSGQWEVQKAGLEIVRRLCLHHADVMGKNKDELHAVLRSVLGCVNNLRSQVAKNGLLCLQDMFRGLEKVMDPEIKGCIESILKRCVDTNRFVNEEARKVMEAMVQHSTTAKVLAMCLSAFSSHKKDGKLKAAIASCICRSIEVLQERLLHHKLLVTTLQCVSTMVTDTAVATRESGKKSVFALSNIDGMMDVVRRKLAKQHVDKFEKILKSKPKSSTKLAHTSAPPRAHGKRTRGRTQVSGKTAKHKMSGAALDALPPIARDMASTDWRKRHAALQRLTDLVVDHPAVAQEQVFKITDHFLTGIGDGNSKVNVCALESLCRVVPVMGNLTARVLHQLVPPLCKCLGSSNNNTKKRSQQAVEAIVNNVTVKDTTLALSKGLATHCKSVSAKSIILEELAGLVIDCQRDHPRLVMNKLLPQAVKLLTGTARDVRVQAEALVTAICKAGPEQATLKIQQLSPRSKSRAMVLANAL